MGKQWKVNDGTQVFIGDKRYEGGQKFTATDAELDEFGSRDYVTEVRQQSAPKAANKAVEAPKARATETESAKKSDK
jgi:hypothetical protein